MSKVFKVPDDYLSVIDLKWGAEVSEMGQEGALKTQYVDKWMLW